MDITNSDVGEAKTTLEQEVENIKASAVDISSISDDLNILLTDLLYYRSMGNNAFFTYNGVAFYSLLDNEETISQKIAQLQSAASGSEPVGQAL